MKWWWKSQTAQELEKMDSRLEQVERDDVKVNRLGRRIDKLIAENNLAPTVMKALGARG